MPAKQRKKAMHTFLIIMLTAYSQITQVTGIETPIKCSQYIQCFICEEIHISYLIDVA